MASNAVQWTMTIIGMFLESVWINDCIWSNGLDPNVFRLEKGGESFIELAFLTDLY